MSDLRAPLPRAMERLADDLVVGRHGDPHVAFAVLVYPDREPAVVALTGRGSGAHDLAHLVASDDSEAEATSDKGRFFSFADLEEAERALSDACMGFRTFGYARRSTSKVRLGIHLADHIRDAWTRRREHQAEREMERAAHEIRYGSKCEFCGSGFTERGLKMHQARSRWCANRRAEKEAANAASGLGEDT